MEQREESRGENRGYTGARGIRGIVYYLLILLRAPEVQNRDQPESNISFSPSLSLPSPPLPLALFFLRIDGAGTDVFELFALRESAPRNRFKNRTYVAALRSRPRPAVFSSASIRGYLGNATAFLVASLLSSLPPVRPRVNEDDDRRRGRPPQRDKERSIVRRAWARATICPKVADVQFRARTSRASSRANRALIAARRYILQRRSVLRSIISRDLEKRRRRRRKWRDYEEEISFSYFSGMRAR